MNYVLCPSYKGVFFALHLKNSGEAVKIITNNISVGRYCASAGFDCMFYTNVVISTPRFYRMFTLKWAMDRFFKTLNITDEDSLYLLDNSFDISSFYLAKLWALKGKTFYNPLGYLHVPYVAKKRFSLPHIARTKVRYLLNMFLGLDLIFVDINSRPIWGIDDRFLKKANITGIHLEKTLGEMQLEAAQKNPVKLKEYDNLIISDGQISATINEDSLFAVYENLLRLSYRFAVKMHPGTIQDVPPDDYESLFINCERLPDFIPVELLLGNIKRMVISVYSTSLIAVSKLENLKAVSLLELVRWRDKAAQVIARDWLEKESNGKIIFVRTFEELRKLLEG